MVNSPKLRLSRWDAWRDGSVNRRIVAAMITVAGFTVVAKLAATAKELVVAHRFGTHDALDAFLIAFLVPSVAVNVFGVSGGAAFMPTYIQVREREGRAAADQLFSSVIVWMALLLVAVSALLGMVTTFVLPLLGSSFSAEKLALTRTLFFIVLPIVFIAGISAVWGALLNAGERFALAAVTPAVTPLVLVVILLVGRQLGIYALVIGTVVGLLLEATCLGVGLKRLGFSLTPRWHGMTPAMRQVARQYAPMVAGGLLMSSTGLVDQSMAAMLGPGSVSALNYANKIVMVFVGVVAGALSTAALPHFSKMVALNDWQGLRHTLRRFLGLVFAFTVPATAALVLFSQPLVRLLYQRGAFSGSDTALVAKVQAMYALQIPFYTAAILMVRLISSLNGNRFLMWGAGLNLVVDVVLNLVFMKHLGVAGIALSTSAVYATSCAFLCLSARHLLAQRPASPKAIDTAADRKPLSMRITLTISSMAAGGAERVMSILANAFVARGHAVTLITLDSSHSDFYPTDARVRRAALDLYAYSENWAQAVRNNWRRCRGLARALKDSRPDVIVSFADQVNVLTLLAGFGSKAPIVVSERIDPTKSSIGGPWAALRRLLYPRADAVVVQTKAVRRWAEGFLRPEAVRTIPNPVVVPSAVGADEIRLPTGGRTLVAIGRLHEQKGFDNLLKAFARCGERHPDWSLLVLGDGEERASLERLASELGIAERVLMPGRAKDPASILRKADLFVLSSRYEGFPNVLLEAMACGLPVIATDCPSGPSDIVTHDDNGLLVPPNDVGALAQAMDALMSHEAARRRLGARAVTVVERFSADKVTEMWEHLLHDLLARRAIANGIDRLATVPEGGTAVQ